jgi:hypothetical protein
VDVTAFPAGDVVLSLAAHVAVLLLAAWQLWAAALQAH